LFSLIDATEAEPYYSVKYNLRNELHQLSLAMLPGFKTEENILIEKYQNDFCAYLLDYHEGGILV